MAWREDEADMAARIRAHDWAATPLGAREGWPPSLKAIVDLMLAHSLPMLLLWTPARLVLYNDAYRTLPHGGPLPALGRPFDADTRALPDPDALIPPAEAGTTVSRTDYTASPVRDEAGAVAGVLLTGHPAARQDAALQASRDSAERYRAFVTASADVVYRMNADWSEMHQLEGRDILADTDAPNADWLDRYIHPDDQIRVRAAIEGAIRDKAIFELEHRVIHADGSLGVTQSRAVPIIDAQGAIREWLGTATDITRHQALKAARDAAEAASRQAEDRYLALFNAIDQGFCTIEVRFDSAGSPTDYHFLEVSPSFERQTGIANAAGRWMRDIAPTHEQSWFDIYGEIARTGEARRFEGYSTPLDRWWEVFAFRIDDTTRRHVGVLFSDITERRSAAMALRDSEERQAFLLKLADTLRLLADPIVIQSEAARVLGEHLRTSHAYYVEVDDAAREYVVVLDWHSDGNTSPTQRYRQEDWPVPWRADREAWVVRDTADPALPEDQRAAYRRNEIGALINIPLVKDDRMVAAFIVNQREPRDWSAGEIGIVEETAERTWAAVERARADAHRREIEWRLQQFGEASQDVLWIRDAATFQWEYLTPAFETIYGLDREAALRGDNMANWLDLILPEDRERAAHYISGVQQGQRATFEYRITRPSDGQIRWLRNTDFPIRNAAGKVVRIGGIGHDVTPLKDIEHALAAAETRQRALIEGIPQLVWRAVDGGEWTWASPQWTEFTKQSEPDSHGYGWLDAVHPDDRAGVLATWRGATARSEFHADYRISFQGQRYRWFQTRATPVWGEDGTVIEWLGSSTDVDDLRTLHVRQQVLSAELQHRVRNILAILRSIIRRSLDSEQSLQDYAQHLEGRVAALARTQVLLTRHVDARVDVEELVRDELLAQAADTARIAIAGPDVHLAPKAAEVLALAIHELATNALKYGAIGHADSRLDVTWEVEEREGERWLTVVWTEAGVPINGGPPPRIGFGTELITRRVPYELKGNGRLEIRPGGAVCTITFPLLDRHSILETATPSKRSELYHDDFDPA